MPHYILIKSSSLQIISKSHEVKCELLMAFLLFRPDGIGTVTVEEKERFEEIKERLRLLLENQITHFR